MLEVGKEDNSVNFYRQPPGAGAGLDSSGDRVTSIGTGATQIKAGAQQVRADLAARPLPCMLPLHCRPVLTPRQVQSKEAMGCKIQRYARQLQALWVCIIGGTHVK